MKIICDCGNSSEIEITEEYDIEDELYTGKIDKFDIVESEYCVYITCNKCGKAICIIT